MIEIRNLSKSYGKHEVLHDLTVDVPDRMITFLMGENGAGKTTLFKVMLGLESFAGTVRYDGRGLSDAQHELSVVYDDSPLYGLLDGYRNVDLLTGSGPAEDARALARSLLGDELLRRKVKGYSYGQRKKLAIAIALGRRPRYLLMDEVSNGLDYETMKWLKVALKERAGHMTMLLTGHQFDFYNTIVDRVLVLRDAHLSEVDMEKTGQSENALGRLYESAVANA